MFYCRILLQESSDFILVIHVDLSLEWPLEQKVWGPKNHANGKMHGISVYLESMATVGDGSNGWPKHGMTKTSLTSHFGAANLTQPPHDFQMSGENQVKYLMIC